MSPQRDDRITRQAPERHMEEEDNQWILGSPMTAKVLQLQQIQTYGKGMLSREEGMRDTNMFQMRQKRAYRQEL